MRDRAPQQNSGGIWTHLRPGLAPVAACALAGALASGLVCPPAAAGADFSLEGTSLFSPPALDMVEDGGFGTAGPAVCPAAASSGWVCTWSSGLLPSGTTLAAGTSSASLYAVNNLAAESFVGAGTCQQGTSAVQLTLPAGIAEGDLLVAVVSVAAAAVFGSGIPGWTLASTQQNATSLTTAAFWHVASASEPPSYSLSWTGGGLGQAAVLAYRGVNPAQPVDAIAEAATAAGAVQTTPQVTSSANAELAVSIFSVASGDATWTPSAGSVQRVACALGASGKDSFSVDDVTVQAGTAGPESATSSNTTAVGITGLMTLSRTAAGACPLTLTLAGSGTVLGSTPLSLPTSQAGSAPLSVSFATSAMDFADGGGLSFTVAASADAGQCNAQLLFGDTSAPAVLQVPAMAGPSSPAARPPVQPFGVGCAAGPPLGLLTLVLARAWRRRRR